ncbi:ubiquitin-specific protease YUH1 [Kluyveromyces lactis]|uniref:Ubiquitin carboxyl-terminal hydrolase n=1 Tax=Kluyveromyces lactis (strain ATCC 8585 / CBS 2359 / DSM 70799 / NBRC 1267 / NRRL Y-1140 / WM37) TaxID=284590 RepID=Q6CNU0_KLULA|nr:uncharacterized protein KLLA0_E09967g [Kluyveromyces lactis]CAG99486.1 KLLA0E09967p [Kluyveromyces lactis]|eukprot:XP_454399.1 uncharacterized protein KLLA0_E09967g [Kluyveromyces lactis]
MSQGKKEQKVRSVVPLESNPQVFTNFANSLGLSSDWALMDIYSLTDPDLLAFIPRPVKAVILLFPLNETIDSLTDSFKSDVPESKNGSSAPIWFKQNVRNACGLYALLHSLSNNANLLTDGSILKQFLTENPASDGQYSDDDAVDDFLVSISEIYNENSQQGDTAAPSAEEDVELHFITFIEKDGLLYELDGRSKTGPRCLGKISPDSDLLTEPLVKQRFEWYHGNASESMKLQFSLLGLGPSLD